MRILTSCQVINSVLVLNPGTLSKRRGAGTYTALNVHPRRVADEERGSGEALAHSVFERTRVDVVRI
jgi:DNA polymerase alpha subunit B